MARAKARTVWVRAGAGRYGVVCAAGLLRRAGREIAKLGEFSSVHVLRSPKVWRAVGKEIAGSFARGKAPAVHLFDDAEAAKIYEQRANGSKLEIPLKNAADARCLRVVDHELAVPAVVAERHRTADP